VPAAHPLGMLPEVQAYQIYRVGQTRIFAPYMTVCMVSSLLKIPYVTPYIPINVWFWPNLQIYQVKEQVVKLCKAVPAAQQPQLGTLS
jgi:hypothetical protein